MRKNYSIRQSTKTRVLSVKIKVSSCVKSVELPFECHYHLALNSADSNSVDFSSRFTLCRFCHYWQDKGDFLGFQSKPLNSMATGIIPWNATPGKACGSTLDDICNTSEVRRCSFPTHISTNPLQWRCAARDATGINYFNMNRCFLSFFFSSTCLTTCTSWRVPGQEPL